MQLYQQHLHSKCTFLHIAKAFTCAVVRKHWQAQTQYRHAEKVVALACMSRLTHHEAVLK